MKEFYDIKEEQIQIDLVNGLYGSMLVEGRLQINAWHEV